MKEDFTLVRNLSESHVISLLKAGKYIRNGSHSVRNLLRKALEGIMDLPTSSAAKSV
jgi:hypothetical protein